MQCAAWGLPQSGILATKLWHKCLASNRYYECKKTPGLWQHAPYPISSTLVVDDFSVKYTDKDIADVDHLITCFKEDYKLTKDWDGDLYGGIKFKWDYEARMLDISMLGYIAKQL